MPDPAKVTKYNQWDKSGEREYESGVDRGMVYVYNSAASSAIPSEYAGKVSPMRKVRSGTALLHSTNPLKARMRTTSTLTTRST